MNENTSAFSLRVIVVDDNPSTFELIKIVCQELAYQVELIHCSNGIDFFRYLEDKPRHSFSFFLLDLRNPVMDGKEVLKKLQQSLDWSQVPAMVFSSLNGKDDIQECYELGAKAYFVKPIGLEAFEKTIENIFSRWKAIKAQNKTVSKEQNHHNSGPIYLSIVQPSFF